MSQPRYRLSRSVIDRYFPPGVKWLLIVNTVIFLIWSLGGDTVQGVMATLLVLVPMVVVHSFPWFLYQLFTYMFLHADIGHLVFNMLALWMFGSSLEQTWGTRRFLKYYFFCGVGAGIFVTTVDVLLGHNTSTLGASGAIYGLLVGFGVLFWDTEVLMNFVVPIKVKYMIIIYGALGLLPQRGVSILAHLGGLLFGLIFLKVRLPRMAFLQFDFRGRYRQWKLQRAKKKFQVYMRKHNGRGPWVN